MSLLKLTGVPRPQNGTFWDATKSNRLLITGPDNTDNWTDGASRVAFPIIGKLNTAGTAWVTPGNGDIYVPGAEVGDTIDPPVLNVIYQVTDSFGNTSGNLGVPSRAFQRKFGAVTGFPGVVSWHGADRPLVVVNNPGVPVNALLTSAIGVTVSGFPLTLQNIPDQLDHIILTTAGVLDYNDVSNVRPGVATTLLTGNALNGPTTGAEYYYVQNFFYSSAIGNCIQIAWPYTSGVGRVFYRTRSGVAWNPWEQLLGSDALPFFATDAAATADAALLIGRYYKLTGETIVRQK